MREDGGKIEFRRVRYLRLRGLFSQLHSGTALACS